jgi:hypothetical protein
MKRTTAPAASKEGGAGATAPSLAARVRVPESVLFCDLDGEAVILESASGRYFGLDEVGTRVWSLLATDGRVGAAFEALLAEYEVGADRLRRELLDFVATLAARRLLALEAAGVAEERA